MGTDPGIPFGNYALLKRIARGGMAEVFVARQQGMDGFDRMVAIKRILPHLLDDQSFVRMFQNEARLAARLSHPNVIHIYDFGKVAEHFFIAMEFMHGVHAGDLINLAATKQIPTALVARIGADACAGLHYAHNRRDERARPLKLVHRDISPPNLLVSHDGVVKLVDFGIAKAVNSIEQTRSGVVKGKYAYMSPEQTMGHKLDGRSDVFSLAMVLWELLAGCPAVTRNDQILAMKTIRDGKVPAIESIRPDLPPAFAAAMADALRKDPQKRSDARAFGNALEAFIKASKEIATRMELGAWLTQHFPPEALFPDDVEVSGDGTRPATLATSLANDLNSIPSQLVFADPAVRTQSRGSVVARLSDDQQETRVLSVASGNMSFASSVEMPALGTGNSVVVDRDLLSSQAEYTGQTNVIPLAVYGNALPMLGDLDGPTEPDSARRRFHLELEPNDFETEEDTTMDPRRLRELRQDAHSAVEPSGSPLPLRDEAYAEAELVEAPHAVGVDAQVGGSETTAHVRFSLRMAPLIIGTMVMVLVGIVAMIVSSERSAVYSVAGTPADAGSLPETQLDVPSFVVTSLFDAAPARDRAVIEITTRPANATVFIDDQPSGNAPATFGDLTPGRIKIRVEHEGFEPKTRRLRLRAGQHQTLEIALTPVKP